MKQTMLLKLVPTEEQQYALLETMHAFNAASNYVAEIAFSEKSANKFALQKLVYGALRTTYKLLHNWQSVALARPVKPTSVIRASSPRSSQGELSSTMNG